MYKTLSTIVRNLVYKKSSFNTLTDFFPVLSKSVSTGMQPYLYVSEEHRKYIPHEMFLTLLSHRSG